MPIKRVQKSYLKFEINEEDINQSMDFIKTKIKYYTSFGFSVKEISFHYKTDYESEKDIDNLTQYEMAYGETFDIESSISYEPKSEEELEEIIDNSIVLSSSENGDPDVIADYVFVYLW